MKWAIISHTPESNVPLFVLWESGMPQIVLQGAACACVMWFMALPSSRSLVLQIEICALSRVTAVFLIFAYRNPCIIKGYGVVS